MSYRLCALWLCLSLVRLSAAEAEEIQIDGKVCWRLSTALMTAVVSPEDGGRVIELLDRSSGESLTRFASLAQSPAGSGLFADRVWPKNGKVIRNYETSPYTVVSHRADAESAEITLRREIAPLTVEKRIVLREKERRLLAEYALSNPQSEPFTGTFWSCNVLLPPASSEYQMYLPTGMLTDNMTGSGPVTDNQVTYNIAQPAGANHFVNAPEHDYAAVLGDRTGAALLLPFDCLERFYSCHPAETTQSLRAPTLEWFSLPFRLPSYSEGLTKAINHPELADPLQDYVYRFTLTVEAFASADFSPANYRPKAVMNKRQRFAPVAEEIPVFSDFQRGAFRWLDNAEPLSLLAVVNAKASAEMFEFARRFPLTLSLVEVDHPHVFGPHKYFSWPVPEPGERLVQELSRNPQVILLSGTFENAMPAEARQQLLAQVEAGTPLIYISHDDRFPTLLQGTPSLPVPADLFTGIPFAKLPVEAPEMEVHQYGAGKVFWVKYRLINKNLRWTQNSALTPFMQTREKDDIPYWEYYFSFYGRLLRTAIGRQSALRLIKSQAVDAKSLSLAMLASRNGQATVTVHLEGPGQTGLAELHWQGPVTVGENLIKLPLPSEHLRRNGDYYCNILVELDGQGEDWGTAVCSIEGPQALLRLNLDRYAHRGEHPAVSGAVEIRGQADLLLQLQDSYGRILAQELRPAVTGAQRFSLTPSRQYFLPLAEVLAAISVDGVEVDRRQFSLTLEPPERQPLNFVIWTHGSSAWFNRDLERSLAEIGFTVATGSHVGIMSPEQARSEAEDAMRMGLRYAPMSMHRISAASKSLTGLVREPCLRDPAYWQKIGEDVQATVDKVSDSFPFTYYSGDENSLGHYNADHDFCQSEHCLSAFQAAMQHKYGDLPALNRAWRQQYQAWSEIRPPVLSDTASGEKAAAWIEHRVFMMQAVSDALKKMKSELNRRDPGSRLGFSGQLNTNLNGAFQWQAALTAVDYPTAYLRENDGLIDLLRSFLPPGGSGGAWIGYGAPLQNIRWNYWRQIISGWFSPSYWWSGYLVRHGDQRLSREGEHLRDVFREIRSAGVDVMLTGSQPDKSPFTLVYSIPSLVASAITGRNSIFNTSNYTANFNGWSALIRDLGYQPPQVIACTDLASADLQDCQVLILPMAQMLDDDAAAAIERYVEAGGVLLADAQPAIYDGFAQLRTENPLAALAGVRCQPASSSSTAGSVLWEGRHLRVMLTNSQVELAGGTALAGIGTPARTVQFSGMKVTSPSNTEGTPALIWKQHGQGRAAYLNFLLADYPGIRSQAASAAPLRQCLSELLSILRQDLPPVHQLPAGCDLLSYHGHGNRYLGIVRHSSDDPPEAQLQFGRTMHVYDSLAHHYLGEFSELPLELPPFSVQVLALLTGKLPQMQGSISWDGGQFRIALARTTRGPAGAVRLEVWRNDQEQRCYAGNHLLAENLDLVVDPGLQPAPGTWRLRVTDLLDGQAIEHIQPLPEDAQ